MSDTPTKAMTTTELVVTTVEMDRVFLGLPGPVVYRATARSVDGATGLEWTTDRRPNVGDVITMTIGEDPHPPNTTREETPR